MQRPVGRRALRGKFLIVCEGERTEPNYFSRFRVSKHVEFSGLGFNTVSLVQEALKLKNQDDYSQVWCVFDKDSFPLQDFNNAIQRAESNGMRAAYSNEAFEIWYLLHFNYYDTALSRDSYKNRLSACLGITYEKNSTEMYELLETRQEDAIRNAERLLQSYPSHNPARDNPCTTVHCLVRELNRFAV